MPALKTLQAELEAILGERGVTLDPVICTNFSVDGHVPSVVVYPGSQSQVAEVLKFSADRKLAVIPCRNATKVLIGNTPRRYHIALSLKNLNNVWHYEPADLTASAEAGIKLGDFQDLLARRGLWLPLDPVGGGCASLGGILATNAAGPLRLAFGAPRDFVVGMKIATSEGKIIKTGGRVVKNVAGYDLSKLLIGSFGSLGVIVEANFKLFPLPVERATYVFQLSSVDEARELRRHVVKSQLTPMRMVLVNSGAAELLGQRPADPSEPLEWMVWVEAGGSSQVLARYERTLGEFIRDSRMPLTTMDSKKAIRGWTMISDPSALMAGALPASVVLKAALPIARTEGFSLRAQAEVSSAGGRFAVIAQLGVGVAHLVLLEPLPVPKLVVLIESLRAAAKEMGGSLVVERASAELKSQVDVWGAPGSDFEIMRQLKLAWDPTGILSPGRFVGSL